MRAPIAYPLLFSLLAVPTLASKLPNNFQGFITSIRGPQLFAVDGQPVAMDDKTKLGLVEPGETTLTPMAESHLILGEHVVIEGHRAEGKYIADQVLVARPPQKDRVVHGHALTLLGSQLQRGDGASSSWQGAVLLDGRHMVAGPDTSFAFGPAEAGSIPAGLWADYEATWKPDSGFHLNKLSLRESEVLPEEIDFRRRASSRVKPPDFAKDKPGRIAELLGHVTLLAGTDSARLQTLGARLEPAYQKQMPEADPRKVHFRYYVADSRQLPLGWDFADGTVVLEKRTLEKIGTDDDALAALLAVHMANVLEERDYATAAAPGHTRNLAIAVAALAAGAFLAPGLLTSELVAGSYYFNSEFESASARAFAGNCRVAMELM